MDITAIVNLVTEVIKTLGFPVAVAAYCFHLLEKERVDHKEEVDALREAINNTTVQLTQALNNNTLVMQRVLDKLSA